MFAILAGVFGALLCPATLSAVLPDNGQSIRLRNGVIDTSAAALQVQCGVLNAQDKISSDSKAIFAQSVVNKRLPFIIQFVGPVQQAWKDALAQTGARLGGYLPDNAFIAELTLDQLDRVAALECVQWTGPFKPDYKVDPDLGLRFVAARQSGSAAAIDTFTIQTFSSEAVAIVRDAVLIRNGQVLSVSSVGQRGLIRARMSVVVAAELIGLPEVEFVEIYVAPQLCNNVATDGEHMNVQSLWTNHNLTGARQVVCVADTGLDTGDTNTIHPDFSNRVIAAFALGRQDDWSDSTANTNGGHGTHVAGSVLGSGAAWSNGLFRGAAYEASLVFQSIMDANGRLGGIPDPLTNLFGQAYTSGARIHTDSWGASVTGRYDASSQSADQFMWDVRDMLILFSSGNEGTDASGRGVIDPTSVGSPATAKNVLTVGASESKRPAGSGGYSAYTYFEAWSNDYPADPIRSDLISTAYDTINQGMAAFSSRGPCLDGRFKPDIVAPGTDIISCRSRMPGAGVGWGTGSGVLANSASNYYVFMGGTSMSTPLTAGTVALLRQYLQERRGITSPSAALMKAILVNGARSLTPGQYGTGQYREIPAARPNNVEGWGQVDLANTLFPASDGTNIYYDMTTDPLSTGSSRTYSFIISGTNLVNITLCWSDYPATLSAANQLVNDLDLTVVTPDGVTHYPNGLTSADRLNNTEGVDVSCATTGTIHVTVRGYNVPNGPQPYALVIHGAGVSVPPPTFADPAMVVNGNWYLWLAAMGYQISGPYNFGVSAVPLAADFDADGKADPTMVDGALWYIWFTGSGYQLSGGPWNFGVSGTPVAADFDADGKADPAMVSASGGLWYIWFSGAGYQLAGGPWNFGVAGTPVAGDFDGDRKADPAAVVNSLWYIWFSGAGYQLAGGPWNFGVAGTPVAADFDADGKADPAMVVGPLWYIWFSGQGYSLCGGPWNFGVAGTPVAADFDGR